MNPFAHLKNIRRLHTLFEDKIWLNCQKNFGNNFLFTPNKSHLSITMIKIFTKDLFALSISTVLLIVIGLCYFFVGFINYFLADIKVLYFKIFPSHLVLNIACTRQDINCPDEKISVILIKNACWLNDRKSFR